MFRTDSRTTLGISGPWDRHIVLANRAPYRYDCTPDGRIRLTRAASGLVTAIEPLVDACSGTWVAHAAGEGDMLAAADRSELDVPPANPRYRLRYVALDADEHRGFYYGFANEALWPLCHSVQVPAIFRSSDFRHYDTANSRFADAVAEEAGPRASLVRRSPCSPPLPRPRARGLPSAASTSRCSGRRPRESS